ncbi:hypothetical protein AH835_21380 [Salmonella enterica]|nr:hypothetical protein [Salmonella enterica]
MNIYFSQIYLEGEDTTFPITNTLIHLLSHQLDSLDKKIKHYEKLFKGDNYSITFVISATRKDDKLNIKGPTTKSKDKETYFSLFIPYKDIDSVTDKIMYALNYIEEGVIFVFNKYKTDSSGVKEAMESVKKIFMDDPEKYQKWEK